MTTATALGPAVEIGQSVIDRARRGDQEAFAAVIRHYDQGLRALAYRLLGDRDRMDDVLQEAYVRAYRALPGFRGDAKLGTWLYRVAYNAWLDELRRSRRPTRCHWTKSLRAAARIRRTSQPGAATSRGPSLPSRPRERAAVLLVDAQGFDYRETARVLGVPEGTVASRLNRARASLRLALGATG